MSPENFITHASVGVILLWVGILLVFIGPTPPGVGLQHATPIERFGVASAFIGMLYLGFVTLMVNLTQ